LVRIFRIAIPASDIDRSREFCEALLSMAADDTVPSRLYFHCGDVILALIDWSVEAQGPLRPTPDDLYLATGDLDSAYERAVVAVPASCLPLSDARGASVPSTASIQMATVFVS
jgi:hypothetical protein